MSLFLAAVCAGAAGAEEEAGLKEDVMILFTSDVHCGVDQGFGYEGLKNVKDSIEKKGIHVLLVDDGDSIQGEPIGLMSTGSSNVELMNAVGYDVCIPGNHEFDYGMDRFFELVDMAQFPYISCNFRHNGELVFDPYIIKEFDGVKIGFVGATTPETLHSSTPKYFQDGEGNYVYDFTQGSDGSDFYNAVQRAVNSARKDGAEYVFLMGHLGNEAACQPYTYADVISHTHGIDAVLDGHSHDYDKVVMKNNEGVDVPRQACGTKMAAIGWVNINAETGEVDTGILTWDPLIDDIIPESESREVADMVAERMEAVNSTLTEKIGETKVDLYIDDPEAKDSAGQPIRLIRRAETNLGDLCADAFRSALGADIALVNGGSIRSGVQKGDITVNSLLKIFPFGNTAVMIEATGQQILNALEWGAAAVPEEGGKFLHVSGLTYEIDTIEANNCTVDNNGMFTGVNGNYRVKNVKVGGEPLDPEKKYKVCGLDYTILNHGDGQTAFDGATVLEESGKMDYQLLGDYIKNTLGGVVDGIYAEPYGEGRIVAIE